MTITINDYYMGRDKKYKDDLVDPVPFHAGRLLLKVNALLELYGKGVGVRSGWRPYSVQMQVNPKAPNSKHVTGDAIDLNDNDGTLKEWCVFNQDTLEKLGLFMEHPSATPTWVHLQQVAPKSGKTIFYP